VRVMLLGLLRLLQVWQEKPAPVEGWRWLLQ
jgi:hypothetical protein